MMTCAELPIHQRSNNLVVSILAMKILGMYLINGHAAVM